MFGMRELSKSAMLVALSVTMLLAVMACGGSGDQENDTLAVVPTVPALVVMLPTATPQAEPTVRAEPPERIDVPSPTPPPAEVVVELTSTPSPTPSPTITAAGADPTASPVAVATVSVTVGAPGAATPTVELTTTPTATPVPEATAEATATPDPNRELTADEVHELSLEAMTSVVGHEFFVRLSVDGLMDDGWAGVPVKGYMALVGRYVAPGTVWVRTVRRTGLRHDVTAGAELGAMVPLESGGFPGVEAIVGKEEVYVRYLDYENENPIPDRRPEPVGAEPVTGWYRLAYADWPADMPDIFTDPSGMLARVLPKIAMGFPSLGDGEVLFLRTAEEVDRRRSGRLWPRFEEFYYPEEELYLPIREQGSFNLLEPTGVVPVEVVSSHVIRRSDKRPVRVFANHGSRRIPGEAFVYFHYPEEGVDPIELPADYEEFDRETHEELR